MQKSDLTGMIKLEQFIFQNSQYVFSPEKKSDRFIYTEEGNLPVTISIKGMFDNTDTFVKYFNEVMSSNGIQIRMKYTASLYEIQIQHLNGTNFSLEEYYDDGTFMDLIGFKKLNQGANVYTNVNTPRSSRKDSYIFQSQNLERIRLQQRGYLPLQNLIHILYSVSLDSRLYQTLTTHLPMSST